MSQAKVDVVDSGSDESAQENKPGFIFAVMGQGLFSLTRLITSVFIGGRFFADYQGTGSKAELGTYVAYFSVLLLCVSALEAFVNVPLTYLIHTRKGEDRHRFSSFLLLVCLFMAATTVLISIAVGAALQFGWGLISLKAVAAFSFLIATQFVREFMVRWVLAHLESKRYAAFEVVYFALYVPLLVGLLFAQQIYIPVIFCCMACVNLVVIAIWWWQYKAQFANVFADQDASGIKGIWSEFTPLLKEQIFFGRWIAVDSACALAMVYFCNWFLLLKTGAAGAGVYSACMTIVLLVNPFLNGLMSVFAPLTAIEFERGQKPALSKLMLKFGTPLVGLMIVFSVFLWFAGDWLTIQFFGDRYVQFFDQHYDGANRLTFLIGLTMPPTAASYVLACGIMACGKPKYAFFGSLMGLGTLLAMCLLAGRADLEWCAICFVCATIVTFIARMCFYRRHINSLPTKIPSTNLSD